MRISTAQYYRTAVAAMTEQQAKLSKTEMQLATGERMTSASEDPVAAARILRIDSEISAIEQYQRNNDSAQSRLALEETALGAVVDELQDIRELLVQASNDTLTAEDRATLASEVEQHLEAMLQLSNSQDANGEYLFSGYSTDTEPFVESSPGVFEYQGDQGVRTVQIDSDIEISVGDPGSSVFMGVETSSGQQSVFEIAQGIVDDLDANDPDTDALDSLDAALEQVLSIQASVGARGEVLDAQYTANENRDLSLDTLRSTLADLDYAEAASLFSQQETALEASQAAFVKITSLSLFDYL